MDDDGNDNTLKGLLLGGGVLLLAWFIAAMCDSKGGEQAAALGGVLGGIVGAAGAIYAVYLTLSRQRREDAAKVRAALRTEISTYAKYVIGALKICKDIASGVKKVPTLNATYIAEKLVDPTIYPAVADRIALAPQPEATIEFFLRIQEVRAMTRALAASIAYLPPAQAGMINISTGDVRPIADALITALQLARPFLADEDQVISEMQVWIQNTNLRNLDDALRSAQQAFPDAESFQSPLPGGRAPC